MRRRALLVGLITGLAALALCTQIAGAQAVERIRISDPARQAHELPPGLLVELASPAEYNRQSVLGESGRWVGPRFEERGNPGNAGHASLNWWVTFDEREGDAEAIAHAHVVHKDWVRDQRGGLSITHVVGNRNVGTILGGFTMFSPAGTSDARFEGVLAFPLGTNLHAVVRFEALEPAADSFLVKGQVVGKSWNRGQMLLALNGVRLQGNLPPKIVAARGIERGRFVRGKVVDRFLDAVLGARVSLERRAGGSWTRVAGGKTDQRGFYTLRPKRRGTYRVTARWAGYTATSREIRAGRRKTSK
jgi:Carboxypeptidase regulatory-like domain